MNVEMSLLFQLIGEREVIIVQLNRELAQLTKKVDDLEKSIKVNDSKGEKK